MTHYDAYHRTSLVDAADNVSDTTFDYDGFETGVKVNANCRQVAKTNANGWLIETVDKAGTKTDFSYNAAGLSNFLMSLHVKGGWSKQTFMLPAFNVVVIIGNLWSCSICQLKNHK